VFSLTSPGRKAFASYVTALSALLPAAADATELMRVAAGPRAKRALR
jgi:hypothetical protein